jgi:DNA polymerase-1
MGYRLVTDTDTVKRYLDGAQAVGFDYETAPDETYRNDSKAALDAHKSHIAGVSFSVEAGSGIYVPFTHRNGGNIDGGFPLFWTWLHENFFMDKQIVKIAHNLAFESAFTYALGTVIQPPVYDTIAAAQMTFKEKRVFRKLGDCGLKTLVPHWFSVDLPTFDAVTAGRHFDELDPADPETIHYTCADSDFALRIYHKCNQFFDEHLPRIRYVVEAIESPTAVFCGLMKYNGLLVDMGLMEERKAAAESQRETLREQIQAFTGDEIIIGKNASTSAFKRFLYSKENGLGLPVFKTTEKKQEAADDEAMIRLAEDCETKRPELAPLFKAVQEYRKLGKIESTYIDGYLKCINPETGRIHPEMFPLGTETGRFACRNPNCQNMPRAGNDPTGVRNFFTAPDGRVLLSLDFSQIELRVGAFYCRDETMLQVYRGGGDIHGQTTSVIYKIPLEEAQDKHSKYYKERRVIAKNTNFGIFYGLFPNGLQKNLHFKGGVKLPYDACVEIIDNIKTGYPQIPIWQAATKEDAAEHGYTETWAGRRRYLNGFKSSDWGKKSFAERCALNTPIQGTAADILKLALGRIIQGLPERPWLRPLLQIHDEILFELPERRIKEAAEFIKQCMEVRPFEGFDVPIIADAATGARYGEMKEL